MKVEFTKSILDLIYSHAKKERSFDTSIAIKVSNTAMPAAASKWPILDLIEPIAQGDEHYLN